MITKVYFITLQFYNSVLLNILQICITGWDAIIVSNNLELFSGNRKSNENIG